MALQHEDTAAPTCPVEMSYPPTKAPLHLELTAEEIGAISTARWFAWEASSLVFILH